MRKILLILLVAILSVSLMGSLTTKTFTVINKSGGPVEIRLVPVTDASHDTYYLRVETDKTVKYTVLPNEYYFYITYWKEEIKFDPASKIPKLVTDLKCVENKNFTYDVPTIDLTTNYRRTILPCNGAPPTSYGENNMDKFYYPDYLVPNLEGKWEYEYEFEYLYDSLEG